MAHYLFQAAYTSDAWATLIKNPQNRFEAIQPVVERFGGRVKEAWCSFGDYDMVGLIEMPNNVTMAALAAAAVSAGHIKAIKTTPLMSMDEMIEALGKAGDVVYPALTD